MLVEDDSSTCSVPSFVGEGRRSRVESHRATGSDVLHTHDPPPHVPYPHETLLAPEGKGSLSSVLTQRGSLVSGIPGIGPYTTSTGRRDPGSETGVDRSGNPVTGP